MEAEFIKLAQEAVVALQLGPPPNWAEVAGMIVSGVVGVGQIGVIVWGLWRMAKPQMPAIGSLTSRRKPWARSARP